MSFVAPPTFRPGQLIDASDMNAYVGDNVTRLSENQCSRITRWHEQATVTAGNAIALLVSPSQAYNMIAYQNPPANADAFSQSVWLAPGTYTFAALGATHNIYGIIDWALDGNAIGTQDWYSAAITYSVIKRSSTFTISEPGRHLLTGTVNGKNASSSNYYIALTKYWLYKTA